MANVEVVTVQSASGLDPITCFFQDFGENRGKLVIECFCEAWACYWGAMGTNSTREFVKSCDHAYLINKLWPVREKTTKRREAYLRRILVAMQENL